MSYSNTESDILEVTAVVCACFAMIGELFIIITYISFKKMRRMAYQFVLLIAISDFIRSLGTVFGNPGDGFLCQLQSLMTNFGAVSSFLWIFTIAVVMYSILNYPSLWENPNTTKRMLIFGITNYVISFTVSFLPIVPFNAYEQLSEWCWIGTNNNTELVLRWTSYYAWLLFVFIIVCILYTLMYLQIRKIDTKSQKESRSNQMFDRIKWYPMVLIICFTVAVIRRLLQTIDDNIEIPFFIVFLHVFLSSLYGLGNGIVYGLTPRVKKEWKKKYNQLKVDYFGVNIMAGGTAGDGSQGPGQTNNIDLEDSDQDRQHEEPTKTAVSTY